MLLSLIVTYRICMHFLDFVYILLSLHVLYKVCSHFFKFMKFAYNFIKFAGILLSLRVFCPYRPP